MPSGKPKSKRKAGPTMDMFLTKRQRTEVTLSSSTFTSLSFQQIYQYVLIIDF